MASPNTKPGRVTFHHDVQFERQTTPKDYSKEYRIMTTDIFEEFAAEAITDAMLVEAAALFSTHYGIWSTPPPGRRGGKPGDHVKMSMSRLRALYLPAGGRCSYVRVHVDGVLAGNAFACRWDYQDRQVCWITQLVVHHDYRGRRLATRLLEKARDVDDEIFGIMSSHPAACIAACKAFSDVSFDKISMDFIRTYAGDVMARSPITYVKEGKPCGQIFEDNSKTGVNSIVSGVDTGFFVDHQEPLDALNWIQESGGSWPLGGLPEGHEFLLVFESSRRRRSRSLPGR
ncbi:acyl-CoA N-acyltransferase [Rhypophila sp. PSN 637]